MELLLLYFCIEYHCFSHAFVDIIIIHVFKLIMVTSNDIVTGDARTKLTVQQATNQADQLAAPASRCDS